MEDNSLDVEFERHLQIMRPYLAQLLDKDVIELCKAWIQRLSNCIDNEKPLRNKYIFALCYQLSKGVLDYPFLSYPHKCELLPLTDHIDSDGSASEGDEQINYKEGVKTKVIYNNNKIISSDTDYLSQQTENESKSNRKSDANRNTDSGQYAKENVTEYCCPETFRDYQNSSSQCDEYKERAQKLVMKLRDIKTENMLLHNELQILKEECKIKTHNRCNDNVVLVDCCTSACCYKDQAISAKESQVTLHSINDKLQEVQVLKNDMLETIKSLQNKLNNFEDTKKREIEEIDANHKVEIIKIKTSAREDAKKDYEIKLDEMKHHYEQTIEKIHHQSNQEKQEIVKSKDEIISEKDKTINKKEIEIERLKSLIDDQKNHLHDVINKFLEKPNEDLNTENMRIKTEQLEKRLFKAEKAKNKGARLYEAKLAQLQREKHLAECSLQLQLIRQRTQVVNEITDESQIELSSALTKLENKYKDIVGNMQTTAIKRRVQDQKTLETILQAACGIRNEPSPNCSQGKHSKTIQHQNRNGNSMNQSYDSETSTLLQGIKGESLIGGNKSSGAEWIAGYCLNEERLGELFERVYIPQRDIGDAPLKK